MRWRLFSTPDGTEPKTLSCSGTREPVRARVPAGPLPKWRSVEGSGETFTHTCGFPSDHRLTTNADRFIPNHCCGCCIEPIRHDGGSSCRLGRIGAKWGWRSSAPMNRERCFAKHCSTLIPAVRSFRSARRIFVTLNTAGPANSGGRPMSARCARRTTFMTAWRAGSLIRWDQSTRHCAADGRDGSSVPSV